jgi:hypothetical protein
MYIVRWQRALFRKELQFIKPGAILFLTKTLYWIARYMFDPNHYRESELAPLVKEVKISEPGYEIPMAQTYHPQAHRDLASLREARRKAVEYLMANLSATAQPSAAD